MRVRIDLSYDGTNYLGWQRQPDSDSTIQSQLEAAFSKVFGQAITVTGSGRTDRGVHAHHQVAHFDIPKPLTTGNWVRSLQSGLPDDITIQNAYAAPEDFHARYSVEKKTYIYRIWNAQRPNALESRYSWWLYNPFSVEQLNSYANLILGEHDFKSFQTAGTPVSSTLRTIFEAQWTRSGDVLEFRVTGNGFLKQMVRNLVGTMGQLAQREAPTKELKSILGALDRQKALLTAPPHGLFLEKVFYPQELDNQCRQL
ncbi:MAG: tRNA pseudouridine(38-40) synthase TruA [Bdellovibrionales bacterium]|nr:tRNA pseudouridine(38-40) synthase TruA [Bdellovibrionales bacterium]